MIEALVALFVMVVVTVAFIPGFTQSRRMVRHSQRIELATAIAQAELETWRAAGYDNLPAIPGGSTSTTVPLSQQNTLPGPSGSVTFTYLDSSLAPTPNPSRRERVDVTVGWNESGQDQGSVTLSNLVVSNQ